MDSKHVIRLKLDTYVDRVPRNFGEPLEIVKPRKLIPHSNKNIGDSFVFKCDSEEIYKANHITDTFFSKVHLDTLNK